MHENLLQQVIRSLHGDLSRRSALAGAASAVMAGVANAQDADAKHKRARRKRTGSGDPLAKYKCGPDDGCRTGEYIVKYDEPLEDTSIKKEDLDAVRFNVELAKSTFERRYPGAKLTALFVNDVALFGSIPTKTPQEWLSKKMVPYYYFRSVQKPGQLTQSQSLLVCNATSVAQQGKITLQAAYAYGVTNTWSVKVGVTYKVQVKLAFLSKDSTVSVETTFGQSYSKTETETITKEATVSVPPQTQARAQLSATVINSTSYIRMPIKLDGWVVAHFDKEVRGSRFHAANIVDFCKPVIPGLKAGWDETDPSATYYHYQDAKGWTIGLQESPLGPTDRCQEFFG